MKNPIYYESHHDKSSGIDFFIGEHGVTEPHFHRSIEIIYVLNGIIDCKVGENVFKAVKDDIIFVPKCTVHSLYVGDGAKDYVLIIGSDFSGDFNALFGSESLYCHLDDKDFNKTVKDYFDRLYINKNGSHLVKKGFIDIIIGCLTEKYKCVPTPSTPNLNSIVNALDYIDEHFKEAITLESISQALGYNKYYFSSLFNSYMNEKLSNYINIVRLRNVVAEARKTDKPNISALAFDNGFSSLTTFYRCFANYYGKPPAEMLKY